MGDVAKRVVDNADAWCSVGDSMSQEDVESYLSVRLASYVVQETPFRWRLTCFKSDFIVLWGTVWQRCRCSRWEFEMGLAYDVDRYLCRECHRQRTLVRQWLGLVSMHRSFSLESVISRLSDYLTWHYDRFGP